MQDLKYPERFAAKLRELLDLHNHVLTSYLGSADFDFGPTLKPYMANGQVLFDAVYDEAMRHARLLTPMMADVSRELNEAHDKGANLLFGVKTGLQQDLLPGVAEIYGQALQRTGRHGLGPSTTGPPIHGR